jgi:chromosome segregation ATPase
LSLEEFDVLQSAEKLQYLSDEVDKLLAEIARLKELLARE